MRKTFKPRSTFQEKSAKKRLQKTVFGIRREAEQIRKLVTNGLSPDENESIFTFTRKSIADIAI